MSDEMTLPRLSASASLSLRLTGVARLSTNRPPPLPMDEEEEEDEERPPFSRRNSHSSSSNHEAPNELAETDPADCADAFPPRSAALPPAVQLHAPAECVAVLEEVVPCGVVPLLPRTHGQLGLVAQIVPCTRWPAHDAPTLQHAAQRAVQRHEWVIAHTEVSLPPRSPKRQDSTPTRHPLGFAHKPKEESSCCNGDGEDGALVEWHNGIVGYTNDAVGIWAEQRVRSERYFHLPPLMEQEVSRPQSATAVVEAQLRRLRAARPPRALGKGEWKLRFARVVEASPLCVEALEHLVECDWSPQQASPNPSGSASMDTTMNTSLDSSSSPPAAEVAYAERTAAVCDALLDEAVVIGMAPEGEPHRLALMPLSQAHHILLQQEDGTDTQRETLVKREGEVDEEEEEEEEKGCRTPRISPATEAILDLILHALRDVLHKRIGVQYELLRILRVKALAAAHRDLVAQYTWWYACVPSPMALLRALSGSSRFGVPLRHRWPPHTEHKHPQNSPHSQQTPHSDDKEEGECVRRGPGRPRKQTAAPNAMMTRKRQREATGEATPQCPVTLLKEAELLEEEYLTRFADRMRRPITPMGTTGTTAACDEAALAETVRWLRRQGRTMTLKELDAFARRKQ